MRRGILFSIKLFLFFIMFYGLIMFAFDHKIYKVWDCSMYPTLHQGDIVIVTKIKKSKKACLEKLRGRIIVFQFPFGTYEEDKIKSSPDNIYIKRCIGCPGDSVTIIKGLYYNSVIGILGGHKLIIDDLLLPLESNDVITNCDDYRKDNILNISQTYIPRMGDTITLTSRDILLYKKIIGYENNYNKVIMSVGDRYVFKNNYYFACGDNILKSYDSRQWGFIPESFLIGYINRDK